MEVLSPPIRTAAEKQRTADLLRELAEHISDVLNITGRFGKFAVDPMYNIHKPSSLIDMAIDKHGKELSGFKLEALRTFLEAHIDG